MNIYETLSAIQKNLNAKKSRFNSFGKYHYRSCEDIVEAVKQVMPDDAFLALSDEITMIGERVYVKATASLEMESGKVQTVAYAREDLTKKGMDVAQVTGAASSYARKYALCGLFAIDDGVDADSDESPKEPEKPKVQEDPKVKALQFTDKIVAQVHEANGLQELIKIQEDNAKGLERLKEAYPESYEFIQERIKGKVNDQ